MTRSFGCPYLGAQVGLTDEREAHIRRFHAPILQADARLLRTTLADPELVRRDLFDPENTRLLSRWYDDVRGGRHVGVAVVSDGPPPARHWIVTAFLARTLPERDIEWERS